MNVNVHVRVHVDMCTILAAQLTGCLTCECACKYVHVHMYIHTVNVHVQVDTAQLTSSLNTPICTCACACDLVRPGDEAAHLIHVLCTYIHAHTHLLHSVTSCPWVC